MKPIHEDVLLFDHEYGLFGASKENLRTCFMHTYTWIWAEIAVLEPAIKWFQCKQNELKTIIDSLCCYLPSGITTVMKGTPRETRTPMVLSQNTRTVSIQSQSILWAIPTTSFLEKRLSGNRIWSKNLLFSCCRLWKKLGCSITALVLHFYLQTLNLTWKFKTHIVCLFSLCN